MAKFGEKITHDVKKSTWSGISIISSKSLEHFKIEFELSFKV